MWSTGGVLCCVLVAAAAVQSRHAESKSCRTLRNRMDLLYTGLRMRLWGVELELVAAGGGGVSYPAASLLWLLLRYGLGYEVELRHVTPDLCQLAAMSSSPNWTEAVRIVAPLTTMPREGCGDGPHEYERLTGLLPGVNDSRRLLAHLAHPASASPDVSKIVQIDENVLSKLEFVQATELTTQKGDQCISRQQKCFAIVVQGEPSDETRILQEHITSAQLPLQIAYYNYSQWKREFLKLQSRTFLFLGEDIWVDHPDVRLATFSHHSASHSTSHSYHSASTSMKGFRIGDSAIMKKYAPPIAVIVQKITKNISHYYEYFRQIHLTNVTTEEAACDWALNNYEKFHELVPFNFNQPNYQFSYYIIVFVCEDDPDIAGKRKIFISVKYLFLKYITRIKYSISYGAINCAAHGNTLPDRIKDLAANQLNAGLVMEGWTPITRTVADLARGNIPLYLAGSVAPDVQLGPQIRSTAGNLTDTIRAYKKLFKLFGWSRMAVLSDCSIYSKIFIDSFNLKNNKILYREIRLVNTSDVEPALESLLVDDARIILVNANKILADAILCSAAQRGMGGTKYAWILRDGRHIGCTNHRETDMNYYSLQVFSQTHNLLEKLTGKKLQELNETLAEVILSDPSGIANAILQLGIGLHEFLYEYPNHTYVFHNSNVTEFPKDCNKVTLSDNKSYTANSIIQIKKWNGMEAVTVATWQVTPNAIHDLASSPATFDRILGAAPADRPFCLISSNDLFVLRCHDALIFTSAAVLLLIFVLLYVLYRRRVSSARHHREQYEKYLVESRQQASSILDGYLVKRNSIQLFHVIGIGSYGLIRFAKLHKSKNETVVVAAKEPRDSFGIEEEDVFLREACVLAPLRHANIVRLVGVCLGEGPILLLTEHALHSDLQQYLTLRRHGGAPLPDEELTRLAREAAEALVYLARRRLVHRDVRAGNCLVDAQRSLKLADFGMARALDGDAPRYVSQRRALFPVLWMAPESVRGGVFSLASDVWSLGVLLLEVATCGARPFGDWSPDRVVQYVKAGGHAPLPPDISTDTRRLVEWCWQHEPERRPSAAQVRDELARNPHAIEPALLTPLPPDSPVFFSNTDLYRKLRITE